jgi:hypothetical protein
MGVALSSINDDEFNVYTAGPATINSYTAEFCNMSERTLKSRGVRVRYFKVPPSYIEDHMSVFDYVAFLSTPNQRPSKLIASAELAGVENAVFRY